MYLSNEDISNAVGAVCLSDPLGRVPVLLVDVHQDGLLWFASCYELSLRFIKLTLVLKVEGVLQVNVGQLGAKGDASYAECKLKRTVGMNVQCVYVGHKYIIGFSLSLVISGVVDSCFKKAKLCEQFDCTLSSEGLCPQIGHLVSCTRTTVGLSNLLGGGINSQH